MSASHCVVVADDGRARIFTAQGEHVPERGYVPTLVEREAIVNPTARMPGGDLVSEATTGRGKGGPVPGPGQQTVDDRREPRSREARRRHARTIASALRALIDQLGRPHRLIVAASPKMLGALRPELESVASTGVDIVERTEDLTRLSAHELHAHLVREKLLPPRPPYRPTGR